MQKTWRPTTAGILTIIAGCYGIGVGAVVTTAGGLFGLVTGMPGLGALGAGVIGLGIVAIIGGICAMRRKVWGLALAGAILALPLIPVGTILGILAIIFVSRSKKEFA